jgi:hypothetical protein
MTKQVHLSYAHEWAISSKNDGTCIRCGLVVLSHRRHDLPNKIRCIPHLESVRSGVAEEYTKLEEQIEFLLKLKESYNEFNKN